MRQHQDRVAGILVGLAAGDENGGPTEMALRLVQSLLACGHYDGDDVFRRYLDWHRAGSYDTGPVTGRVLEHVLRGMPREQAVATVDAELGGMTAGCNAAHRAGVLAMAPWLSIEALVAAARREARLTHHHPIAADAAIAVAVECRDQLMGGGWMIGGHSRGVAINLHPLVRDAVCAGRPLRAADSPPASKAHDYLHTSGYSPETLKAALAFALPARDPATALAESKCFAGPANYCPVLVGALLGARFGASVFGDEQLSHHPSHHIQDIRSAAHALAALWSHAATTRAQESVTCPQADDS